VLRRVGFAHSGGVLPALDPAAPAAKGAEGVLYVLPRLSRPGTGAGTAGARGLLGVLSVVLLAGLTAPAGTCVELGEGGKDVPPLLLPLLEGGGVLLALVAGAESDVACTVGADFGGNTPSS
jgi:hypothetical protein